MAFQVPDRLRAEQRAVEAEIREAFRGVSRGGGVSWTESMSVDAREDPEECEQARRQDTDQSWEELVDDPAWEPEIMVGGFNFLDDIGIRYYIGPAMIRCTRTACGEFVGYALTDKINGDTDLFTERQAGAIARFIRFMIAVHAARNDNIYGKIWHRAYRAAWYQRDAGNCAP
jgi:hypothetical protein